MRRRLTSWAMACVLAASAATVATAAEPWPETISGVADVRVVANDGRFTTRLAFAAAVDPPRLRIEVVKGGMLQALAWYDEARVLVLAPGAPSLLHEGPPTRQTLQETLGLPFCPAEIFAALRGGLAAPMECGESDARAVSEGGDAGVEVGAGAIGAPDRATLRFSRFRRDGGRPFPRRVVLDSDRARATLDIVALQESPKAPSPPSEAQVGSARRVSASQLADALGIQPAAPKEPVPAPEGELGR